MKTKVLVIDDEKSIRATVREILEFEGYEIDEATDGEDALAKLQGKLYDVALCDIKMPKMDGIELLAKAKAEGIATEFVMLSAHGNIALAVEATKLGAFDFIQKPPDLNKLLICIKNASEKKLLVNETVVLRQKVKPRVEMVGQGAAFLAITDLIARIAPTDARVLITGENGTGKELVARAIHAQSNRAQQPLIEVNCAAIPSELIESELFGHEKGSFTSAYKQKQGKFELADKGTLFLDEIGDMSLSAQAKVLRALQEQRITRVGGEKELKVDVRVLAATNKDILAEIAKGTFREDLYHRLAVIKIAVPPLRSRTEDIPLLINRFIADVCAEYGMPVKTIDPAAIQYLESLTWSGNIRELRNVVERLIIMSDAHISKNLAETYA